MKTRLYILILVLFLSAEETIAQSYAIWQYGGARLDFNGEPPTYSTNMDGNHSYPASVCDSTGELAFYTGGYLEKIGEYYLVSNIKNRVGEQLTPTKYASGQGVNGRIRTIIIPQNDSVYYLIYSYPIPAPGTHNPKAPGVYYTKLNSNLKNGKGDVVPGEVDINFYPSPCWGVNATQVLDGSWWIIASNANRDTLFAFHLEENGLNPQPSITPCSDNLFPEKYEFPNLAYGTTIFTRFSPDGRCMVRSYDVDEDVSITGRFNQSVTYLYDFNPMDGQFSNKRLIYLDTQSTVDRGYLIEDAEFSPDNSKLYLLYNRSIQDPSIPDEIEPVIGQLDLKATNISASLKLVYTVANDSDRFLRTCRSIQLGMNGKIYIGGGQLTLGIGIIQYPNKSGNDCRLVRDLSIHGQGCNSVPGQNHAGCADEHYPFSRYHNLKMDFAPEARCSDSALHLLNLSDQSKFASYKWYVYSTLQDGMLLDSSDAFEPYFPELKGGRYYVKLRAFTPKGYGPWFSDTITHISPAIPIVKFSTVDSFACQYAQVLFTDESDLQKTNPFKTPYWKWSFGDGTDSLVYGSGNIRHRFENLGSYSAQLLVNNGFCSDSLLIAPVVSIISAPKPGIDADPVVGCQALEVSYTRSFSDNIISAHYYFGDGRDTQFAGNHAIENHIYPNPGIYYLRQELVGPTGCVSADSIEINVLRGFYPGEQANILLVSVRGDSALEISWDSIAYASEYRLEKRTELLNWEHLITNPESYYPDHQVDPSKEAYRYQIVATDTCGQSVTGLPGTSLFLSGENQENKVILLSWNPYETWPNGVYSYELEYKDLFGNWQAVESLNTPGYNDDNFTMEGEQERCYRVKALNQQQTPLISYSNTACVKYLPLIWVPNAFSPNYDGHNDLFNLTCVGIAELELNIYNRYGQLIHKTSGIAASWDGTVDGVPMPGGVYMYVIKGRTSQDYTFIHREGTITLLR